MKFFIIPNMTRENAHSVTNSLVKEIFALGCQVMMDKALEEVFGGFTDIVFGEQ